MLLPRQGAADHRVYDRHALTVTDPLPESRLSRVSIYLQKDVRIRVGATMLRRPTYLWDYELDEVQFAELLSGRATFGRLDQKWATTRLLEYASYREIIRLLGYRSLVERWPLVRKRVRSPGRRRGFDFLVEWLTAHHPEKL